MRKSSADAVPLDYWHQDRPAASSYRWVVCGLLFLATTVNYMDRQVLGLLAPLLKTEIGWNEIQYAAIVMSFQAAYAIGQIGFGWIIDRLGTKLGYAISIVFWSVAACGHALARSVLGFSAARFTLGLGEGGNFPAAIKCVAEWFPKKDRALATGLFNAGSTVGAIAAPLVVPVLTYKFGWQSAFIVLGATGFGWVVLWHWLYEHPEKSRHVSEAELEYIRADEAPPAPAPVPALVIEQEKVPDPADPVVPDYYAESRGETPLTWLGLLRHTQTWAYIVQAVCTNPIWWFYLFWLPKFFHDRFDLDLQKSGFCLAVIYTMSTVGSISGGLLSAILLRRGWSLNAGRKVALLVCVLVTLPMTVVIQVDDKWLATFMIGLTLAGMQGWSANSYQIASDLFPKRAVASVVGLGSGIGSVAAILFSFIVGAVLQRTNNFQSLFIVAGLLPPLALLLVHLLVPRWRPIRG